MHIARGYRAPDAGLNPDHDHNVHTHSDAGGKILPPVTRVIPDCGHTYFIAGHLDDDSTMIRRACQECGNRSDAISPAHRLVG